MTRIIAIVVVIAAAVVAYMYTSAGDVEVGEVPTSTEPAGEPGESISPDDAVVATNPAQEEALDDLEVDFPEDGTVEGDAVLEEAREALVEEELIEGDLDAGEAELATETEVLDDTAEPLPHEVGLADSEPEAGVGAVSTEEETGGAGIEGITAEEGEQEGLPGTLSEEDAAAVTPGTTSEASPTTTTATGEQILQTPTGLDTSTENAPPAVQPGEGGEAEAAAADAADGPATIVATDPGPALAVSPTTSVGPVADAGPAVSAGTSTDLDALLDPENFDLEAVTAAIQDSDLEPAQREQLIEALETAQASPTQLAAVLDRIRAALGE